MEDGQPACPICLEPFEDPRVLPCGHSICFGCLRQVARANASAPGKVECPLCRYLCLQRNGPGGGWWRPQVARDKRRPCHVPSVVQAQASASAPETAEGEARGTAGERAWHVAAPRVARGSLGRHVT